MSSVYAKGPTLYVRYKDEEGKWISEATQFRPGKEAEARRYVKRLEARIDATKEITDAAGLEPGTPVTVAQYMERWLKGREALHHASHKDEDCRLRKHMVPRLGHMLLDEVRPRHIRDFVFDLRKGPLAPRTIYHVYQTTALLFRAAIIEWSPATSCQRRSTRIPTGATRPSTPAKRSIISSRTAVSRRIGASCTR